VKAEIARGISLSLTQPTLLASPIKAT
jgi:hypothetical protein